MCENSLKIYYHGQNNFLYKKHSVCTLIIIPIALLITYVCLVIQDYDEWVHVPVSVKN